MAAPVLSLRDVALTSRGAALFAGVELHVFERDRICIVGRNGAGKSTLMKVIAGLIEPDEGERIIAPGATVRYLEQEPDYAAFETAEAAVTAGLAPGDDPRRARRLLEDLGLTGEEDPARLSGGELRRVALARALAPEPDVLLLDEPTNHLDLPAIGWLEETLARFRGALVVVSHDRRFLETASKRTVWIDRGTARTRESGFAGFEAWRDETLALEEQERHKLERRIAAEEDWMRYGVTARRKRNQKRVRRLQALREERRTARGPQGGPVAQAAEASPSGKLVIEAEKIAKRFDERVVVADFSVRVARGDRLGIIGPNGAGKTTLLKMLIGALPPDSGEVRHGTKLELVALDQRRGQLDDAMTVKDALTEGGGDMVSVAGERRHVVGYMKDFLFAPDQARSPIGSLSGGERGRLALAIALARPSNLLVLDEPTNDLDLETLDLLQEVLSEYAGAVLLVSHDRDFLDRVVTSVLAPDPDQPGHWLEYAGGYADLEAQRDAALFQARGRASAPSEPKQRETAERAERRQAKLSFKDKHALETLPGEIEALSTRIEELKTRLAEPELYARDREAFDAAAAALEKAETTRAEAEERWLELEMKREDLENAAKD